jgi:hypothetical protein
MSFARIIGAAIVLSLVAVGGAAYTHSSRHPRSRSGFIFSRPPFPTCIAAFRKVS